MEESPIQAPPSGPMGQYYLLDRIAQGGMAEIYKGLSYDLHGIRRTVVIKKILPHIAAHREFIDMLVTEAKLAVQLTHGNIAQVYDLGKVGDDYFMVMEYVDGKTVSQIMRKAAQVGESIPVAIAAHIAAEAAAGLHYMHSRTDASGDPLNIIHRDVSPQNLMLTIGGTVKIIDFGIAKAATTIEITDVGVVKGKFAYMSPEQASGDPLDWRTDIFSLAVVLFEMVTGRRLFKGKDNQETLRNVRRANVPRPSLYRPEVQDELDEIIIKGLSRSRMTRYQSAGVMRDDLLKFMHHAYPSFHNADVADYLKKLFLGEELSGRGEDSHTPLLIIDRTQSAILSPEEMAVAPAEGELPQVSAHSDDEVRGESDEERSEWTPLLTAPHVHHHRQKWMITAIAAVIIVVAAVGLGFWHSRLISTQPTIVNAPRQALPGADLPTPPPTLALPEVPKTPPPPVKPPEPFGDVIISSVPDGAIIYIDDHPNGLSTPATLSHLPAGDHHTVGLLLKGYKYWTSSVDIHAGGVERLNATLQMDYASLEVLTRPTGAEVYLNGKPVGHTPLFMEHLPADESYKVTVKKEGYLEWTGDLRTDPGHHTALHPILERDPHAGDHRPDFVEPTTPAPTILPKAQ